MISTDSRDIDETVVNGYVFNTITEDSQLKAWYIDNNFITELYTYEVDYEIAYDVLKSMRK